MLNENQLLNLAELAGIKEDAYDAAITHIMTQLIENDYNGKTITDIIQDLSCADCGFSEACIDLLNKGDDSALKYLLHKSLRDYATNLFQEEMSNAYNNY